MRSSLQAFNDQSGHILPELPVDLSFEHKQILPDFTPADLDELRQENQHIVDNLEQQIERVILYDSKNENSLQTTLAIKMRHPIRKTIPTLNGSTIILVWTTAMKLKINLFNMKPARDNSKMLNRLCTELGPLLDKLDQLKADFNHPLVEIALRAKLPCNAINWIYHENAAKQTPEWSVLMMCKLLNLYTEIKQNNELTHPSTNLNGHYCIFCGSTKHKSYRCSKYQYNQRRARLQELAMCMCCLKLTHGSCDKRCGGKRHQLLCNRPANPSNDAWTRP